MDFKWQDRQDGDSYILAEDVNKLAGGVIEGITKAEEAKEKSNLANEKIAEIEGEKRIEFYPVYENVFDYQMPENTGIKSAKVVWLDDLELTDNAYFEFLDSSGVRIGDFVNVYRSDGLEQEVYFDGLKTVPVAKIMLYTDVANATVTSITYYNNLAVTAANDYTDNAIQQAILDSWEVSV